MSGPVEVRATRFPEAKLLVRRDIRDKRGRFRRLFSQVEYEAAGITDAFVEDNVSVSHRSVLRGMHFDKRLAKLVQVLEGEIFDAIIDIRRDSPTYGMWEGYRLTEDGCEQLYVPRGFAHGFYVLSERAIVSYKQTAAYDQAMDQGIRWNDPNVAIAWPLVGDPIVSDRDQASPLLADLP